MAVLVTGGAGYIGSHTVLQLLNHNYDVIVIDNFSNSSKIALKRVEYLTSKKIIIYEGDIRNIDLIDSVFANNDIEAVIHFAALKSVSESIKKPIQYYENNVIGTLHLINSMLKNKIYNFIFSSSATVYGNPTAIPVHENCSTGGTTNPYGTTKYIVERMLDDITNYEFKFNATCLRYFNPVGAHYSGLIGEDPNGVPSNLFPYLTQVAVGKLEKLTIYGGDYPTVDGTGVRDYIHVMDLAEGHIAALKKQNIYGGLRYYNLGTGKGYSVKEIIDAFQKITEIKIPYVISERRLGDIAECWSKPDLAIKELHWEAKRTLEDMITDAWRWQNKNPNGYSE